METRSPGTRYTRLSRSRGRRRVALLAAGTIALTVMVGPAWSADGGPGSRTHYGPDGEIDVKACPDQAAPGTATCFARRRIDAGAKASTPAPAPGVKVEGASAPRAASSVFVGDDGAYSPAYLQSAYNAPSASPGTTVAIVDAYDNNRAESDLAYYRSYFGLPPCTTANGCFRRVDQRGGTSYPAGDQLWGLEISLDLDMISAICPNCRLLLVEADSNSIADLGAAVNTAVALGASVVSNSWGGLEYPEEVSMDALYFHHPGVAIVASSGDGGYGTQFPAASANVVAVGGTTLNQASKSGTRDATETTWSGSGSGCSWYMPKPSWQHDSGCSTRTIADVSAVADPRTGVWVWDTYPLGGGWGILGGTSAAAPIVAGLYALAGNPTGSTVEMPSTLYGDPAGLNDITSGANGTACVSTYFCNAVTGYDGPTGLGTPNGIAAFLLSSAQQAPPTAPSLTGVPGNSIDLSWTASTSSVGIARYLVLRDGIQIGETTGTTYVDETDVPGTTYTYEVMAVDNAGNSSAPSNAVTVTAPPHGDTTPPKTPSGLHLAVAGTTQAAIYWTPSTDNVGVVGYDVYRDGVQVGSTGVPNYLDSGLAPGTSHVYKVLARDAAGNTSPFSANQNVKTAALSTATTGTLAGVVYTSLGKPLANAVAQVTVNGVTKRAKTGASGTYKFSSLPPGSFTLTITPPTSLVASVATVPGATAIAGQASVLVTTF